MSTYGTTNETMNGEGANVDRETLYQELIDARETLMAGVRHFDGMLYRARVQSAIDEHPMTAEDPGTLLPEQEPIFSARWYRTDKGICTLVLRTYPKGEPTT